MTSVQVTHYHPYISRNNLASTRKKHTPGTTVITQRSLQTRSPIRGTVSGTLVRQWHRFSGRERQRVYLTSLRPRHDCRVGMVFKHRPGTLPSTCTHRHAQLQFCFWVFSRVFSKLRWGFQYHWPYLFDLVFSCLLLPVSFAVFFIFLFCCHHYLLYCYSYHHYFY